MVEFCVGFAAGGSFGDGAAAELFQVGDEVWVAEGAAGGFGAAECDEVVGGGGFEERFEVRDALQHCAYPDEGVVLACEVGADAGPGPLLG